MNQTIKMITTETNAEKHSEVTIHPNRADEWNLKSKKNAYLCFGNQKRLVHVKIRDDVLYQNILISKNLEEELLLPLYPDYEITVNGNEIIIGPFIGLLMGEDEVKFTEAYLNKMMVYTKKYSELHGVIVVFALNKVDTVNLQIEGYCYNPVENRFQKGTFPYPCAIYRTIGLNDAWKNHFFSVIGDKFFNNHYFSKWEMYQWFSSETEINSHIPYTIVYQSEQDIYDMLNRFDKIYMKPVSGLRGRGIFQISKEKSSYIFKHREKGLNYNHAFDSLSEANDFIQTNFIKGKYLIQQAIPLLQNKGGLIDFRCIMQKNQANKWVCNAIIGRNGQKDSVVSNISSGGKAYTADEMLEGILGIPKNQTNFLISEMEAFALKTCNKLDEFGIHCGTLGLDIGVDKSGYLWLIEINNRDPDPTIALDVNDEELYYNLKSNPLFYAKTLAGFQLDDNTV